MLDTFLSAKPFPFLVIDQAVHQAVIAQARREFDALPPDAWHVYEGADERGKRACRDWERLARYAPACHALLTFLASPAAAAIAGELTGLEHLAPDATLHGGGLHAMAPGSHLGLHLDCERHPQTGFERRLNAILYLNEIDATSDHADLFGGRLQLWDRARRGPIAQITPRAGRLVLMETCAYSYHSVETVLDSVDACERRSLAAYYWSPPRPRARFVAAACETPDTAREAARITRAGL